MLATPDTPSSLSLSSSVTKSLSSYTSMSSLDTAATITGSMEGLIFSTYGADTVSLQLPCKTDIFCWMSTLTVSMFTPSSNSSSTMDTLFWLVEVTSLILSSVDMDCSMGFVMACSTDSGLAPGSEVTMMT